MFVWSVITELFQSRKKKRKEIANTKLVELVQQEKESEIRFNGDNANEGEKKFNESYIDVVTELGVLYGSANENASQKERKRARKTAGEHVRTAMYDFNPDRDEYPTFRDTQRKKIH